MRFGVALDIDGVLLRGARVVQGAKAALKKLTERGVPFIFVTNGGGVYEAQKAADLSKKLGQIVTPDQVLLAHTPYKSLVESFGQKKILVLGHALCPRIAESYGFRNVIDAEALYNHNPDIFPLRKLIDRVTSHSNRSCTKAVDAVMIFHDPTDWALEIQLLLDLLQPSAHQKQIPFFSSNSDIVYTAEHPLPRLTQGAFVAAFRHLFRAVHHAEPEITSFGKPFLAQYTFAENMLQNQSMKLGLPPPSRYFGIGDNPLSDIKGANEAGEHWTSILVRTGVFDSPQSNDRDNPADFVADDVEKAVDWILQSV